MSNIAGKAYSMNVITPMKTCLARIKQGYLCLVHRGFFQCRVKGLATLSLIHYARWVMIHPKKWPHLSHAQPKEKLKYSYMFFLTNFNGSWAQYVDSFHMAIPDGLDRIWKWCISYPKSIPLKPFHRYILHNQIHTDHYYNAYPLASANDVCAAVNLQKRLTKFIRESKTLDDEAFQKAYYRFLFESQNDLGKMAPSPILSLADQSARERRRLNNLYGKL
jgi:hypothetical protein